MLGDQMLHTDENVLTILNNLNSVRTFFVDAFYSPEVEV